MRWLRKQNLATEDQPRMLVKEPLEVECRKFYVLSANIEAHGHMGSCPGYALLTVHGKKRQNWQEKPGAKHTRTESLERERVRGRKRARIERGTGDVPEEPGDRNDEKVAVRLADASGGYMLENQHEEKRMRGIRVTKRGSGETSEEQLDGWRKIERLEHEAPNTSAFSDPCFALGHRVSCGTQDQPGSVNVQKSGRDYDDVRISALDAVHEKDGRQSRYIGEVLERYRGEVAGDLKRIELVEKWICLNVVERVFFSQLIRRF